MTTAADHTGEEVNGWILIKKDDTDVRKGKKRWWAECQKCKNLKSVEYYHFSKIKNVKCIYCSNKEKQGRVNSFTMTRFKVSARRRKLEFKVSKEYLQKLLDDQNHYCAISGVKIWLACTNLEDKKYHTSTASLDRIDNTKGYIEGNLRWVHKIINRLRGILDDNELLWWSVNIIANNIDLVSELEKTNYQDFLCRKYVKNFQKLTEEEIKIIRANYLDEGTTKTIAKNFNVSVATVLLHTKDLRNTVLENRANGQYQQGN